MPGPGLPSVLLPRGLHPTEYIGTPPKCRFLRGRIPQMARENLWYGPPHFWCPCGVVQLVSSSAQLQIGEETETNQRRNRGSRGPAPCRKVGLREVCTDGYLHSFWKRYSFCESNIPCVALESSGETAWLLAAGFSLRQPSPRRSYSGYLNASKDGRDLLGLLGAMAASPAFIRFHFRALRSRVSNPGYVQRCVPSHETPTNVEEARGNPFIGGRLRLQRCPTAG